MKQGTKRLLALLLCSCLGLGVSVLAARAGLATPESAAQVRADILTIDTLAAYGPLDQSPVAFLHDKHTQTLAKHKDFYQKACQTCHQVKDGRMVLAFQRPEDARGQTALKDAYHNGCLGCHASMAKAGLATGPQDVDCKGCHAAPTAASGWQALTVDKRLHFRHAKTQAAAENKCGACHHVYDDTSRRTVPAGRPEDVPGDCGYCHEAADRVIPGGNPERVRNLRLAAHGQCVACHLKIAGDDPKAATGPSSCAGCHGALDQKSVAEASQKKVPAEADLRIPRGQPDLALIRPEKPLAALIPGETAKPADMPPVAFDHKAHEGKSESCATCHHAQLSSCAGSCHTLLGAKDGGFVNLAAAMHAPADPASCAGCHAREQAKPACAGCHAVRGRNVFSAGTAGCAACHQAPTPAVQAAVEGLDGVSETKAKAAREAELARTPDRGPADGRRRENRGHSRDRDHKGPGQGLPGLGPPPPGHRARTGKGPGREQAGQGLPHRAGHGLPGLPPPQPGHAHAPALQQLSRRHQRAGLGRAGAEGRLPRPVHGLPHAHGHRRQGRRGRTAAGQARAPGHGLRRLPQAGSRQDLGSTPTTASRFCEHETETIPRDARHGRPLPGHAGGRHVRRNG